MNPMKLFLFFLTLFLSGCSPSQNRQENAAEKADLVVVTKNSKNLTLFKQGKVLGSYSVVFGDNPVGHKLREADERTPEGGYSLDEKLLNSKFYKALHVSYPNTQDVERATRLGVPPGGRIMVHGQRNGLGWASFVTQLFNWTDGCIALSNADMETVYNAVSIGTPIEIKP